MDEKIMNNEIVEEVAVETFGSEDTMPSVYVPEDNYETATSSGLNKALIALAIGGLLVAGKPVAKQVKKIAKKRKEKKEAQEAERFLRLAEAAGLITRQPTVETTVDGDDVQDVNPEELIPEEKEETE